MFYFECVYLAVLGFLCVQGIHRLYLIWLLMRQPPTQEEQTTPCIPETAPHVSVQLPLYNERNVVERLIEHVTLLQWPKEKLHIQILDDSTDQTSELVKELIVHYREKGFSIDHLHRAQRSGYKAGALQNGLERAKGELVAIFDADFLPPSSFLTESVRLFEDPQVALVQHRWAHINQEENLLTKLSSILLDGHFIIEHTARYRSGLIFNFNGTAGIWRKEAIISAGGWKHHTLTEDLELSYRAALKNWKFVYLCDRAVPAELPAQTLSFKAQQLRWAKGSIQTAKRLLPELMLSELSAAQKMEALVHLCNNLAYPLSLLLILMLPFAAAHRQGTAFELGFFGISSACMCSFYGIAILRSSRSSTSLLLIPLTLALGAGLAVQQTSAVLSGLFGNDLHFVRTPKSGAKKETYDLPRAQSTVFEFCFGLYTAVSIFWLAQRGLYGGIPIVLLFCVGFFYLAATATLNQKKLG